MMIGIQKLCLILLRPVLWMDPFLRSLRSILLQGPAIIALVRTVYVTGDYSPLVGAGVVSHFQIAKD